MHLLNFYAVKVRVLHQSVFKYVQLLRYDYAESKVITIFVYIPTWIRAALSNIIERTQKKLETVQTCMKYLTVMCNFSHDNNITHNIVD